MIAIIFQTLIDFKIQKKTSHTIRSDIECQGLGIIGIFQKLKYGQPRWYSCKTKKNPFVSFYVKCRISCVIVIFSENTVNYTETSPVAQDKLLLLFHCTARSRYVRFIVAIRLIHVKPSTKIQTDFFLRNYTRTFFPFPHTYFHCTTYFLKQNKNNEWCVKCTRPEWIGLDSQFLLYHQNCYIYFM